MHSTMSAQVPTVLHWNYRGFTEFPLQKLQGDETDVIDIYLKENLISRIPSDICKLSNLESLYLSGNDITELPREISKLCSLKCLDISGNRLRFIPDEIAEARNLKFLILDENELEHIPLRLAELRSLRYLSVCDNKLKWLPQRPVFNYHHCEFRFWRNTDLKTLPYSLWYHMFREQQTRSLNIGCLHTNDDKTPGRIKILKGKAAVIPVPGPYQIITKSPAPPSLFELSKRKFYQLICRTVNSINNQSLSYFNRNKTNEGVSFLEEYLEGINISQSDINGNYKTRLIGNVGAQRIYVPSDLIEEYYCYLPNFIKSELCNGPVSRCENVICKKPVFEFVFLEFCTQKIILIDKMEDITLSAVFCSKRCAELWKAEKNVLEWELL
ncbi:leucine-rich repeat and IQ domain-containing protein 4-like [Pieris napi]|uniref:leucine-rich repeat and IQ domain-containing protein 4-like n=1 Tax=Pieris napi TaxID=78633 RepID=UPI001FB94250|nr:leucine-rich repeat and IQ domain-containing protein 4-like [Pieris napi]